MQFFGTSLPKIGKSRRNFQVPPPPNSPILAELNDTKLFWQLNISISQTDSIDCHSNFAFSGEATP